ncbi:jg18855 [Pararge aegeria aegeria]|uniref:Jg18855 protein n=1 Tax=Pararge aegeria aegeria TaxID=348720 RepID=A0A8S4RLP1_9NEOP|nr:jg18855 [Pararge aegeria aegeria]
MQKRAVRLVDNPKLTCSLESLGHRRDVSSLCVFYRLYNGECSEELFALIPPSLFSDRTSVEINSTLIIGMPGILLLFEIPDHFYRALANYGTISHLMYFLKNTI